MHQPHHSNGYPHNQFSGAHVSLGGIKYAVGLMATAKLAEKFKAPEEKYLIMAVIGGAIGMLETAWHDFRRSREKSERQEERQSWRDRVDRERGRRIERA
jgi:hypothetical protein